MDRSNGAGPPEPETADYGGISALESLARAARQMGLYGLEHPIAKAALERARADLAAEAGDETIVLEAAEDGLLWGGARIVSQVEAVVRLHTQMRQRFLAAIRIDPRADATALAELIAFLGRDAPDSEPLASGVRTFGPPNGPSILVEGVDFARQVRESEAAWLESCRALRAEAVDRLGDVVGACLHTLKSLGEARELDRAEASARELSAAGLGGEDQPASGRTAEEAVALRVAELIQQAGETAYGASESMWAMWRDAMVRRVTALPARWRTEIFRAPIAPSLGCPDMLAMIAHQLTEDECVALVMDHPGAIRTERSEGLARLLERLMLDPERGELIEALLHETALDRGITEEVYQNVVGSLLEGIRRSAGDGPSGSPGDASAPPGRGLPRASAELSDLLETATPQGGRASWLAVGQELLKADLSAKQYRSVLLALARTAEEYVELGDGEGLTQVLATLAEQTRAEAQPDSARRAVAARALGRAGGEQAVSLVLEQIARAPRERKAELVGVLGGLGELGMAALLRLVRTEASAPIEDALRAIVQRDDTGGYQLRRLLVQATPEELQMMLAAIARTGDARVLAQLGALAGHRNEAVRRELAHLVRRDRRIPGTVVVPLLSDTQRSVRLAAAQAAGEVREPEAVQWLVELARSEPPVGMGAKVKSAAIAALGLIGDEAAVPALAELLRPRGIIDYLLGGRFRTAAADALARIGGEAARAALRQAASSGKASVRRVCERALSFLEGTEEARVQGVTRGA